MMNAAQCVRVAITRRDNPDLPRFAEFDDVDYEIEVDSDEDEPPQNDDDFPQEAEEATDHDSD